MFGFGCSIGYETICKRKNEKESIGMRIATILFWPVILMFMLVIYLDKEIDD